MVTWSRVAQRALVVVVALLVAGSVVVGGGRPAQAADQVKVLLLLDVSGSMNSEISSGGTKFAAAKRALKQVAASLPAGTQVGLRVYGSEIAEDQDVNPKACTDTKLVLPVGPLDQQKMNAAVDSFTAKGETPIAYSLGKAVDDLGSSGKRVLVLISDGQETCTDDPCPTAEKLAKSGVDLQFNAIGLDVNSAARKQLKCIADAGNGSYYDASQADGLSEALRKITQRALRPFQITGTPVVGTADQTQAPTIGVGQYTDSYDVSTTPRFYAVTRTPGSAVTASVASIVRPVDAPTSESWELKLSTTAGQLCSASTGGGNASWTTTVASTAVSTGNGFAGSSPGCQDSPLLLSVARRPNSSTTKTAPVQIAISEEPAITNLAALPAPATRPGSDVKAVSAAGDATSVVGGSAYANAAQIGAGAWSDVAALGETLFYRVPLQPGQQLRVSLRVPAPGTSAGLTSADVVLPEVRIFSPSWAQITRQYTALGAGQRRTVSAATPQIRVRNREQRSVNDRLDQASVAGDYYVAVDLDPGQKDLTGRVVALRLDVAVDGEAAGLPVYAAASPTPSPSATPAPTPSDAGSTPPGTPAATGLGWVPVAAAVLVLLVALGVVVLLARRARTARRNRA